MSILPALSRRALLKTTLLLGASASFAQPIVRARPVPPLPPRVLVSAGFEPVQIARLAVQAQAAGLQMLTRVELTLRNPNNRLLEAALEFPLSPAQSVAGFALDINGQLVPAVPVPKDKGRQVFDDVTRARVDPALLERTVGNNFKLRIYPLPPGGTRRVVLQIAETLQPDAQGRVNWRLPLDFGQRVAEFSADIALPTPGPLQPGGALRDALAGRQGRDSTLRLQQSDWQPREPLSLAWTPGGGENVHVGAHQGRHYFLANVAVDGASVPLPLPRDITLVWDASGSGATRDHGREFALLGALFAACRQARVQLVLARDVAEPTQSFDVRDGEWSALRKAMQGVAYDGASSPAAWTPAGSHDGLVLLFSDGLANWLDTDAAPKPANAATLHAINAAVRHDAARLRALAEARGGRFIDLTALDTRQAVAAVLRRGLRLVDLGARGASGLIAASAHPEGGRITVAGVLDSATARVTLDLVDGQGRRQSRSFDVAAPANAPADDLVPLAAQRWAQLTVTQLEGERQRNRAQIGRLGERFRLLTTETSLIVLESVQDYLRFEIEPPMGTWRREYHELLAQRGKVQQRQRDVHLEGLVRRYDERARWWAREFPKDTPPPPQSRKEGARVEELARQRNDAPQPMAMAPVVAPAQAGAARESRASQSELGAERDSSNGGAVAAHIALRPFQPDSPYARRLREATDADRYAIYLDERPGQLDSTAFFMDSAEVFFAKGQTALAVRVLSNLAEMELENRHILRILAYRLSQAGLHTLAAPLLERVCDLAPDEPQSWRDLGLTLASANQPQRAVEMLWEVAARPWDARFADIDITALAELNAVVARHQGVDASRIDPRLLRNLPLDLRAVLSWDADNTDIDLWVTDPNGERAYYGHRLTYQGGAMSRDITSGYGPEEFALRFAKPGRYEVRAQFYGHSQQIISPYTTLMLWLATGFGTPAQKDEHVVLRLSGNGQEVLVGSFDVAAAK
jgi:Ca-activated chloride channel homolog